jgi:predicted Zn-dependent protease
MRLLLALIATVLLSACATNPVTGKREISFMSEEKEISLGRQLDAQVRQEMGLYENDELQRYVQELGMGLARRSERPNLPWSFAIVDSPAVNAFALPGGFIYVTRGILPYLDNEAQLVGVLGHEIGHVTARHSAAQYTRGVGASIGVLVGSILVPEIAPFANLAETGAGMMFMKFGRDDELQADALGAQYAAGGGWDPEQVPAFLNTLARISEASDRNGVPNWLATHPQPENRVQRVAETVGKVRAAGPDGTWNIDRDGYLARIDGMRCVIVGQQKGRDVKENLLRNFGSPHPEGYRKALRLMKLAEKFNSLVSNSVASYLPGNNPYFLVSN